jgi:hypothetical protein
MSRSLIEVSSTLSFARLHPCDSLACPEKRLVFGAGSENCVFMYLLPCIFVASRKCFKSGSLLIKVICEVKFPEAVLTCLHSMKSNKQKERGDTCRERSTLPFSGRKLSDHQGSTDTKPKPNEHHTPEAWTYEPITFKAKF